MKAIAKVFKAIVVDVKEVVLKNLVRSILRAVLESALKHVNDDSNWTTDKEVVKSEEKK